MICLRLKYRTINFFKYLKNFVLSINLLIKKIVNKINFEMCTKNSDNIYIREFWIIDKIKVKFTKNQVSINVI